MTDGKQVRRAGPWLLAAAALGGAWVVFALFLAPREAQLWPYVVGGLLIYPAVICAGRAVWLLVRNRRGRNEPAPATSGS